jgi:glutaredoxin-like protein
VTAPVNPVPVAADHLKAYTGLLRLAVRLLSREIDLLLYLQILNADAHSRPGQRPLADPRLAQLGHDEALEQLAAEFCRLFIGPQPVCPPYASAHQGEVKLGGRAARAIDAFMDRHHLRPVLDERDAVLEHDHLAVHLALLAHLYGGAAGTVDTGIPPEQAWAAAYELLHNHTWPFGDSYLRQLEQSARFAPYNTIAHLIHRVLEEAAGWPAETLEITDEENAMVTVYSTSWCGYCDRLKRQLQREGITYTDVDIEQVPEAAEIVMKANNGNQVVPTVIFSDGTAMTNPGVLEIKRHLARTP